MDEQVDDDKRLDILLDRWNNVEKSIKAAELFQGQVTIPAINELRYAGRQMIKAVALGKTDTASSEYAKALANAEQYLENADHDVVDGVVVFIIKRVAELNFRFGREAIVARHPPCAEFCAHVEECKGRVEESRRVSAKERALIYKQLKAAHLGRLMQGYVAITSSEAILATEIDGYAAEIDALKGLADQRKREAIFLGDYPPEASVAVLRRSNGELRRMRSIWLGSPT